jgi:mannitol-specific phosphotransferase system IIBC component
MVNKFSALLTAAVVTGLVAVTTARAEDKAAEKHGDQMAAEKNSCKGMKAEDKNSCKGQKGMKKKKDKNSCKNGCGEGKENTEHKDK